MSRRNLTKMDFDLISRVAVMSAFSIDEIESIVNGVAVVIHNGRELLFSEGEVADQFFIVLKGQVRLFRILGDGRVTLFHLVSAGESFAEAVVLAGQNYPVSAECDPGSEIVAISRFQLINRLKTDKVLIGRVMQSLIERERFFYQELNDLRQRNPSQRLAGFLLSQGEESDSVPKHVIANRIGVTPETFSRALRKLEDDGFIARDQRMSILDIDGLRQFASR
ncbi:Crp/Fnr family transcriptional regulator [Thalassospira alkalitolerans]|uniref:Crp/Fnr family transcriptional regulator n=1 Tax=Thalassospira alkalitolerans TaxID=1293890 RepID=UPI003AA9AF83